MISIFTIAKAIQIGTKSKIIGTVATAAISAAAITVPVIITKAAEAVGGEIGETIVDGANKWKEKIEKHFDNENEVEIIED